MSINNGIDDIIMWWWDAITSDIEGRAHASDIRTVLSRISGEKSACLIHVANKTVTLFDPVNQCR